MIWFISCVVCAILTIMSALFAFAALLGEKWLLMAVYLAASVCFALAFKSAYNAWEWPPRD